MKFLTSVQLIGLLAAFSGVVRVEASTEDLDSSILKERLRKIYGEFSLKGVGEWKVSVDGREQTWKLGEKAWICPKEPVITCSDWMPMSFKWWILNRSWLDYWTPSKRSGFDLGKPQGVVRKGDGVNGTTEITEPEDTVEKKEAAFEGQREATESWQWKSTSNSTAQIFVSLRNLWIEKMEYGDTTERLQWILKTGKTIPELEKVTLERDGHRVVIARAK